jgi:hypothetical protein
MLFLGDISETKEYLDKYTNLEYFLVQNYKILSNISHNKTSTHILIDDDLKMSICNNVAFDEYFFENRSTAAFDNDFYKISKDKNIVFLFCVQKNLYDKKNR